MTGVGKCDILISIGDIEKMKNKNGYSDPNVYIIQEQMQFDYSPAEEYGEIKFLTAMEFSNNKNSIRNTHIKEDMVKVLKNYRAGYDYLVLTGNPIIMCMGFYYACEHGEDHLVLKWDNQKFGYKVINIGV